MLCSLALSGIVTYSCNAPAPPESVKAEATVSAPELESLHAEGMGVHDEVMPRMGEMMRLQRQLDTVELPAEQTDFATQRLARADDAMMAWMHTELPLPAVIDSLGPDGAPAYLARRHAEIAAVRDSMNAAIAFAENLLAQ